MNKKVLISGIIFILVVVIGFIAYAMNQPSDNTDSTTTSEPSQSGSADTTPIAEEEATATTATITYTDQGFSPVTLTVKKGATVRVVNNASDPLEFSSDNHPTHQDNSELNMDVLNAGESGSFTVTKTGEYGFHDHLNAANEGSLTVTE